MQYVFYGSTVMDESRRNSHRSVKTSVSPRADCSRQTSGLLVSRARSGDGIEHRNSEVPNQAHENERCSS